MAESNRPTALRPVQRLSASGAGESALDVVAVEQPLEIRIAGETFVTTMRTPGEDHELALGLLLAEGIIAAQSDVGRVFHCGRPGDPDYGNTLDVLPGPGVALDPERTAQSRRGTLATSACGVCGRKSIDDLLARCAPLTPAPRPTLALMLQSAEVLRTNQRHFASTGGLHAAAVIAHDGSLLVLREDIGRHNAVDKAVGALLLAGAVPVADDDRRDTRPALLAVSGRISFEIVQKAIAARIGAVCGISAPSSLAIDIADRGGVVLAGFVRNGSLNLYSGF